MGSGRLKAGSLVTTVALLALALTPVAHQAFARPAADAKQVFAKVGGGDVTPACALTDPYPEFNSVAVDPANNVVVMTDTNLHSLLVYDRRAGGLSPDITAPRGQIMGPATYLSFATGVSLDPVAHEIYATENDIGDDVAALPYTANGNYPSRALAAPHGVYGVAVNLKRKELAISVEHNAQIVVYRLGAKGAELPRREIRGPHTQMADPHGLYWDAGHGEIVVANFGNWSPGYWDPDYTGGGQYRPPSITVFADNAKGDAQPLRVIQGSKTQLNWPTAVALDTVHDLIVVSNAAGDSVLFFHRTDHGNVAPVRVLKGPATGIAHPLGVAVDNKNGELWVTSFGHTASVFRLGASGNVAPIRIVRNAPKGTPVSGFGNPMAIAFDSKRQELLVPN